jgi:hypothetical protein
MKKMTDIYKRLDFEIEEEILSKIKEELYYHEKNLLAFFKRFFEDIKN